MFGLKATKQFFKTYSTLVTKNQQRSTTIIKSIHNNNGKSKLQSSLGSNNFFNQSKSTTSLELNQMISIDQTSQFSSNLQSRMAAKLDRKRNITLGGEKAGVHGEDIPTSGLTNLELPKNWWSVVTGYFRSKKIKKQLDVTDKELMLNAQRAYQAYYNALASLNLEGTPRILSDGMIRTIQEHSWFKRGVPGQWVVQELKMQMKGSREVVMTMHKFFQITYLIQSTQSLTAQGSSTPITQNVNEYAIFETVAPSNKWRLVALIPKSQAEKATSKTPAKVEEKKEEKKQ